MSNGTMMDLHNPKSYYVRTDEGLELVEGVIQMRPVDYGNGREFQIMWTGSRLDEGSFCYDYVDFDGPREDLIKFLDRNLDR